METEKKVAGIVRDDTLWDDRPRIPQLFSLGLILLFLALMLISSKTSLLVSRRSNNEALPRSLRNTRALMTFFSSTFFFVKRTEDIRCFSSTVTFYLPTTSSHPPPPPSSCPSSSSSSQTSFLLLLPLPLPPPPPLQGFSSSSFPHHKCRIIAKRKVRSRTSIDPPSLAHENMKRFLFSTKKFPS